MRMLHRKFLDSDSEDEVMSHASDSDQDKTQWTDNKQCQLGAPVIHRFTGSPSGTHQNEALTLDAVCTGQTEGWCAGVMYVPHTRSIVGQ
jgi:hypothetical protein